MKKIVLVYGFISGALAVAMMMATLPFIDALDGNKGAIVGYTGLLLAALLVFFGVRSYRENVGNGRLGYGRGFAVGILITLISGLCYTAAWELLYFKLMPGLGDKVIACMVHNAQTSGKTPEKVAEAVRQAQGMRELYDRPLVNAALTFTEPFPVGLIVTAISAGVLRRK